MNDYLDRYLERQKMALDFYTNNKSLDLQYAIQRGQLTIDMLDTALGFELKDRELKIAMFRAITEQAIANANIDQNWSLMYINFLDVANKLGMSEADAAAMWAELTAKYGVGQDTQMA